MKNVQVIDGADNCSYPIFAFTDEEFSSIFPNGQDISFIEDVVARLGEERVSKWQWLSVDKKGVQGIHGTLFYQLEEKKKYYPNRLETDI